MVTKPWVEVVGVVSGLGGGHWTFQSRATARVCDPTSIWYESWRGAQGASQREKGTVVFVDCLVRRIRSLSCGGHRAVRLKPSA